MERPKLNTFSSSKKKYIPEQNHEGYGSLLLVMENEIRKMREVAFRNGSKDERYIHSLYCLELMLIYLRMGLFHIKNKTVEDLFNVDLRTLKEEDIKLIENDAYSYSKDQIAWISKFCKVFEKDLLRFY